MRVKFASLNHADKYAYAYDTDQWRGSPEIESKFQMFETYGDGLTQHSHEWSITKEFFADYMISLAVTMLANDELVQHIGYSLMRQPSVEDIAFAASVKWKDSDDQYAKRRYYSIELRKISASPSKEHDKRFKQIEKADDGSNEATMRLLRKDHMDGLDNYLLANAIRTWVLAQPSGYMEMVPEFLGWWDHKRRDDSRLLRDAVEACQHVIQAYNLRASVKGAIDNVIWHIQHAREEKAREIVEAAPIALFQALTADEEESFRQWARDNWTPGLDVQINWHPIVREEIERIKAQTAA